MKKDKPESHVKSIKRTIREDIKLSLVTELKGVIGKYNEADVSKKLNKEILKGAMQLAKKLSSKIKIEPSAIPEKEKDNKKVAKAVTQAETKKKMPKQVAIPEKAKKPVDNPEVAK